MVRLRTYVLVLLLVLLAAPLALRGATPASADGPGKGDQASQGDQPEHGHTPGASISYFDTRSYTEGQRAAKGAAKTASSTSNLLNQSAGPIMASTQVYVILWGWSSSDPAYSYVRDFFAGTGGSSWLNSTTQYCGGVLGMSCANSTSFVANPSSNAHFYVDTKNPLPSRISQSSIANEAYRIAKTAGVGGGLGTNKLYIVMTPHNRSMPGFGTQWCGWHSYTSGSTPYAYVPYQPDAGYACGAYSVGSKYDGFSIVGGHELGEAMTDPLLNAWYDNSGMENGDKCAWIGLTTVTLANSKEYSVQPLWSNKTSSCVVSYP